MSEPLDRGLNVAVRHIASRLFPCGFDVTNDQLEAPATLAGVRHRVARTGRMLVWAGGSDATIFGCVDTNHHFRAWHDWCHLTGGHEFTLEGERATLEMQAEHLIRVYGRGHADIRRWLRIIYAEVVAQAEHYEDRGEFIADQAEFTKRHMRSSSAYIFADNALTYPEALTA
jgi:hypothetical protein